MSSDRLRFPVRVDMRWSRRMHRWLKAAARERGVTDSQLVRDAVETVLRETYAHLDPGPIDSDAERTSPLRRLAPQTHSAALQTQGA